MKKIGFIDFFIDEWHANHYPGWIREAARGGEFELALAWEEAPRDGRPLKQWCAEMGMTPASGIEQLVEACDAVCVLAPSNSEVHERLAEIPLASGKPVYIDKPFAPDRAAAERLFARAEKFGTPLFSSSALRFGDELIAARKEFASPEAIEMMITRGGGSSFWEYSIHQIEMIVSTMGIGIDRVMQCGYGATAQTILEYRDGRRAAMTLHPQLGFAASLCGREKAVNADPMNNTFQNLIAAMLDFFAGAPAPVDSRETIEIAGVVAAAIGAQKCPDVWCRVK